MPPLWHLNVFVHRLSFITWPLCVSLCSIMSIVLSEWARGSGLWIRRMAHRFLLSLWTCTFKSIVLTQSPTHALTRGKHKRWVGAHFPFSLQLMKAWAGHSGLCPMLFEFNKESTKSQPSFSLFRATPAHIHEALLGASQRGATFLASFLNTGNNAP